MLLFQRKALILFLVFLISASVAWSETRYISDQLIVSLRELPNDNSNTISYIKTDTPVELIEAGKEYTKVKTENGTVGYIQSHYLSEKTPKTSIIRKLSRENDSLNERLQNLEEKYKQAYSKGDETEKKLVDELETLRATEVNLQKRLSQSNEELSEITNAYESLKANSENIIAITDERNHLKTRVEELSTALARLEDQHKEAQKSEAIMWFLAGASVLLLGWVLGKFSKSRRRGSLF